MNQLEIKNMILTQRQIARCPACDTLSLFRLNFTVGSLRAVDDIVEKLHASGRDLYHPDARNDEFISNTVECPKCDRFFQLILKIQIIGVKEVSPEAAPVFTDRASRQQLTAEEKELFAEWEELGIINAFHQALKGRNDGQSLPRRIDRYLRTYFNNAKPVEMDRDSLHLSKAGEFFKEWGEGETELWEFQSVIAVVLAGELRGFVPRIAFKVRRPRTIRTGTAFSKGVESKKAQVLPASDWIKTRHGYVTGRGAFFSEMRKKSAGEFAKAVVNY